MKINYAVLGVQYTPDEVIPSISALGKSVKIVVQRRVIISPNEINRVSSIVKAMKRDNRELDDVIVISGPALVQISQTMLKG
ncbi:hypothetical protein [Acinetobacter sp.]|uniref:hypothetical protein n=1 Tax=Acinetobacter sp. TaxID=472 RepID=UPI0031D1D0CF